jgi:hypothetical protein
VGVWGFKDPRTASFLPLWQDLFAELGLTPRYILALRAPGSILRSFMAAYGAPPEVAEQVWLRRTVDALWHTQGDCHIVHYEDWFRQSAHVAQGLADWTGLAMTEAVAGLVKPDLNRSSSADLGLQDGQAQALYAALLACHGSAFDRRPLLEVAASCRAGLGAVG